MFVIPYKSTIKTNVVPWINYIFIFVQIVIFLILRFGNGARYVDPFILDEWSVLAIFGHMWLHIDWTHILFNSISLWVFGNALCRGVGNLRYSCLYLAGGVLGAAGYLLFDGRPAIGASGAINGVIVALCLLFPYERIHVCFLLLIFPVRRFILMTAWFLPIKFAYELFFSLFGSGRIAYVNHLSAIIGTGVLVYLLIWLKILKAKDSDRDLVQAVYAMS